MAMFATFSHFKSSLGSDALGLSSGSAFHIWNSLDGLGVSLENLVHIAGQLNRASNLGRALSSGERVYLNLETNENHFPLGSPSSGIGFLPNSDYFFHDFSSRNGILSLKGLPLTTKSTSESPSISGISDHPFLGSMFDPGDVTEFVAEALVNLAEIRGIEIVVHVPVERGKVARFQVIGEKRCIRELLIMVNKYFVERDIYEIVTFLIF